jgi:hypothetical protein
MARTQHYRETRTPVRSIWTGKRIGTDVTRTYR